MYRLYLYFLGLSFRAYHSLLRPICQENGMAVWKWVQRYEPHRIYSVKRVQAFLVDETYVKVGSFEAWVWVAVELIHRCILGVYLSRHQNMIVAQLLLKGLVEMYGKHVVYSDGGTWYRRRVRRWDWSTGSIHHTRRA